jgi:hypothetical protein
VDLTRGIAPEMLAALKGHFHPVLLVFVDWPDDPVFAHSGRGVIAWDAADWHGVGQFGSIDLPQEATGMMAQRATLTISGVSDDDINDIETATARNRACRILVGCVTEPSGTVLIGEPVELWAGYVDAARLRIEAEGGDMVNAVRVEIGVGPSARARASVYHSAEDQASRFPGDTAGRHLIRIEAVTEAATWPET